MFKTVTSFAARCQHFKLQRC